MKEQKIGWPSSSSSSRSQGQFQSRCADSCSPPGGRRGAPRSSVLYWAREPGAALVVCIFLKIRTQGEGSRSTYGISLRAEACRALRGILKHLAPTMATPRHARLNKAHERMALHGRANG
jgi:hypothetical protein